MKQDLQDYQTQQHINEEAFFDILKALNPELYVLIKMIFSEKMNIPVFYKIARHLVNIGRGTGYGDIHIIIEDKKVTFVNGMEKDRVNQDIIKQD